MNGRSSLILTLMICLGFQIPAEAQEKKSGVPTKLPAKRGGTSESTPEKVANDFPDPTLLNTYSAELYQIKKTEDIERQATMEREQSSKSEAEYQQRINASKAKIEGFKARQEQINSELKAMRDELQDYNKKFELVQGEYGQAEQKYEEFLENLEKERASLESSKTKYEAALAALTERHEKTKKNVAATMAQNHQMKTEIAAASTSVRALEAQIADAQADEMKSKAEWMALKAQIEDKKGEKSKQLATLSDAEKKYQTALAAQKAAQVELAAAEKSLADVARKVNDDVRKYEDSTMQALRAKTMAEANQMKVAVEVEKLHNYVALVKKSNTDALVAQRDSEDVYMGAQLALEAAKSELAINVASGEQYVLRKNKHVAELRSIASVEASDSILPGGKSWVVKKECKIRESARSSSNAAGDVSVGQHIAASPGPGQWVTTYAGGRKAYIRTECGSFE